MAKTEDRQYTLASTSTGKKAKNAMTRHVLLIALIAAASLAFQADAFAKQRSAKDQALFEKARKECNGNLYPSGAHPVINYKQGTFRCQEVRDSR